MKKKVSVALIMLFVLTCAVQYAFASEEKGQGVYMNFCASCHKSGIAGAPKVGDKQAWASRIEQGMESMTKRAIEGYQGSAGYMPAKGGNSALTDEEVAAAVAYMVEQSK